MKPSIYILLTLLSIRASCQNVNFDREKNILYLSYEEKNVEVIADIDDFSEYYPLVNAYYFEGELNFNQKERILLGIYGDNQIVRNFPFTYSNIRIDSISNDTVVHVTVKNKSFTIYPSETYEDTMIILKYQDILLKDRVFDDKNKAEKELEFRIDAPISAEIMPRFEYQGENLDTYLSNYGLKVSNEKSIDNGFLQIVLDEDGHITSIRLFRGIESEVNGKILKAFYEMPKWIPAMNGNEEVPIKILIELKER